MSDRKVKLYSFDGKEIGEEKLDADLFGVKVDPRVIYEVAIAQRHNSREVLAHAKGRSEVRGGGRKPWKQKGTGQARHGSIRSPLWVGGGITFGPTRERNFSVKVNKKLKVKALTMVLSDRVAENKLVLVDGYNLPEAKTKALNKFLSKLPGYGKKMMIVTKSAKDSLVLASRNLPKVATINYASLNVLDLLKYEYLLLNKELIEKIKQHYL